MFPVFAKDGERLPITEISAGPCPVLYLRTAEKNGYEAVGLGLGTKRVKKDRQKKELPQFVKEVAKDEGENLEVGKTVTVDQVLKTGDLVDIMGISKGWGFAGVVKRHHFAGGPRTHGQSDRERAPGSIGSSTTPGRVLKGKRMAGKEGNKQVTVKNLLVVAVDGVNHRLLVKGAVPGKAKGLLIIKKIGEKKNFKKEFILN